ncbi:hypothetical protein Clacol_005974 [Clathrus columnatus]|uniref:Uncharacterized protein n=1 Tax=Clathrus columnatus TaxID=1419009 RepID=A0AAV5AGX5_9AGAM|nr:hypothetical protein Clacol_005974 [Clathrus columnatus]
MNNLKRLRIVILEMSHFVSDRNFNLGFGYFNESRAPGPNSLSLTVSKLPIPTTSECFLGLSTIIIKQGFLHPRDTNELISAHSLLYFVATCPRLQDFTFDNTDAFSWYEYNSDVYTLDAQQQQDPFCQLLKNTIMEVPKLRSLRVATLNPRLLLFHGQKSFQLMRILSLYWIADLDSFAKEMSAEFYDCDGRPQWNFPRLEKLKIYTPTDNFPLESFEKMIKARYAQSQGGDPPSAFREFVISGECSLKESFPRRIMLFHHCLMPDQTLREKRHTGAI